MKTLIGVAVAVAMATSVQADPIETYRIERQGRDVTIQRLRSDTGKEPPKPVYQYYRDANGRNYDPATGHPEGNKYGCVNGC